MEKIESRVRIVSQRNVCSNLETRYYVVVKVYREKNLNIVKYSQRGLRLE